MIDGFHIIDRHDMAQIGEPSANNHTCRTGVANKLHVV